MDADCIQPDCSGWHDVGGSYTGSHNLGDLACSSRGGSRLHGDVGESSLPGLGKVSRLGHKIRTFRAHSLDRCFETTLS